MSASEDHAAPQAASRPPRLCVSSYWFINAVELRRRGAFGSEDGVFGWWWSEPGASRSYVRARWSASRSVLTLELAASPIGSLSREPIEIEVVNKRCGRGSKSYFKFEGPEGPCEILYLVGGEVGPRSRFKLTYSRRRASAACRSLEPSGMQNLERLGHRALIQIAEKPKPKTPAAPYSTKAAVAKGAGIIGSDLTQIKRLARASSSARLTIAGSFAKPAEGKLVVDLVTEYPQLDILELQRSGCLKPGQSINTTVQWESDKKPTITGYVIATLNVAAAPRLTVLLDPNPQEGMTVIGSTLIALSPPKPGAPNQWAAICPMTSQRTRSLWLRNGVWASAKAQRLIKPSQRAAGFIERREVSWEPAVNTVGVRLPDQGR